MALQSEEGSSRFWGRTSYGEVRKVKVLFIKNFIIMQNKKIYLEPQTKAVELKFTHVLLAGSPKPTGPEQDEARSNNFDFSEE